MSERTKAVVVLQALRDGQEVVLDFSGTKYTVVLRGNHLKAICDTYNTKTGGSYKSELGLDFPLEGFLEVCENLDDEYIDKLRANLNFKKQGKYEYREYKEGCLEIKNRDEKKCYLYICIEALINDSIALTEMGGRR